MNEQVAYYSIIESKLVARSGQTACEWIGYAETLASEHYVTLIITLTLTFDLSVRKRCYQLRQI